MNTLALIMVLAAVLLTVIDYIQTLFIASNPLDDYHEHNTILGRDPSPRRVTVYFACCVLAELLVSVAMHAAGYVGELCWLSLLVIVVEISCIRHNYAVGIRV